MSEEGSFIFDNEVHPLNADDSIIVTEEGISICDNEEQLEKQLELILVIKEVQNITFSNDLHPLNTFSPI